MSSTYCQNHEHETMKGCIWKSLLVASFVSSYGVHCVYQGTFNCLSLRSRVSFCLERGRNKWRRLKQQKPHMSHGNNEGNSLLQLGYHHMQFSRCHSIEILVTEIRISYKISTHWYWQKNPLKSARDRSKHAARSSQNITQTIAHIHLPHLEQSKESIFHVLLVTRTHLNTRLKNNPIQFNKEIQLLSNEWYQESGHEFKSILLIWHGGRNPKPIPAANLNTGTIFRFNPQQLYIGTRTSFPIPPTSTVPYYYYSFMTGLFSLALGFWLLGFCSSIFRLSPAPFWLKKERNSAEFTS